jgi:hypothetical protein
MDNKDKCVKGFHLFQENEPKKLNPKEFVEMISKMNLKKLKKVNIRLPNNPFFVH